jgi:hypothetical protein
MRLKRAISYRMLCGRMSRGRWPAERYLDCSTASAIGGTLITTDKDFDCLLPRLIKLIRVDAKTGAEIAI